MSYVVSGSTWDDVKQWGTDLWNRASTGASTAVAKIGTMQQPAPAPTPATGGGGGTILGIPTTYALIGGAVLGYLVYKKMKRR